MRIFRMDDYSTIHSIYVYNGSPCFRTMISAPSLRHLLTEGAYKYLHSTGVFIFRGASHVRVWLGRWGILNCLAIMISGGWTGLICILGVLRRVVGELLLKARGNRARRWLSEGQQELVAKTRLALTHES